MKKDIHTRLQKSFWSAAILLVFLLLILNIYSQSCGDVQSDAETIKPVDIESLAKQVVIELPGLPPDAVPLKFVLIDSGTFRMGASLEEKGRTTNDWPPHQVTISCPIYIGQFEVTQAQWDVLMNRNPSYFKNKPNQPVEKVSWRACQKFIKKLNGLGKGTFRLPTEAEWEYACRAGTSSRFYFGDAPACSDDLLCPEANKFMWWAGNNEPKGPKKVGLKEPNAWGLYDMHGNVHEWCSDRWQNPYDRGPQIDPQGPRCGSRFFLIFTNRTARGGCFQHGGLSHCRSAYRFYEQASDYYYGLGFRLVRNVDGNEKRERL